jgi:hypothetical protein
MGWISHLWPKAEMRFLVSDHHSILMGEPIAAIAVDIDKRIRRLEADAAGRRTSSLAKASEFEQWR